ncbi:hypothetical protein HZC31_00490 [Candidatus Woesearchaeota archaeon]|nr:hypothetical protein [Candidatus Woesearchaeota archaeon]
MEDEKLKLLLVAIVGVVAVLGILTLIASGISAPVDDVSGEAISARSSSIKSDTFSKIASISKTTDSDSDGIKNGYETDSSLGYKTSYLKADTDGDGYRDLFEYYTQTDPTDSSDYTECYDDDGSIDLSTQGTVFSYSSSAPNTGTQNSDECETSTSSWPVYCYEEDGTGTSNCDDVTLLEWTCTSGGTATSKNYNCPSGTACNNGACV